ncbi:MAG: 4Fe-4S dicluster domain-containing protein [Gammaproteobacteria bacterium]|nr:4Fe-4S dicluster domain-containing protein [Gammaproteobacteria bacterium]
MGFYCISSKNFPAFIDELIHQQSVIAPQLVQSKPYNPSSSEFFSFSLLKKASNLRLDYDTTILPPKKVFFPPQQVLLSFKNGEFQAVLDLYETILFGVHPYDLLAIEQTDFLFSDKYEDIHYTAQRQLTTIIGSNIQRSAEHSFFSSMNANVKPSTHDGFITKIADTYIYEVLTGKAGNLLKYGQFTDASQQQIDLAVKENERVKSKSHLNYSADEIKQGLEKSYADLELWEQLAKSCYACGSCNTSCPTCYCFNIEDKWHIDQISGERTRYWDSCMTEDFAKISLGPGKSGEAQTENFRPTTGARMRHRLMRKMVYLNDKLGTQACVGCGRCATSCTADIADPVNIINTVMEKYHD